MKLSHTTLHVWPSCIFQTKQIAKSTVQESITNWLKIFGAVQKQKKWRWNKAFSGFTTNWIVRKYPVMCESVTHLLSIHPFIHPSSATSLESGLGGSRVTQLITLYRRVTALTVLSCVTVWLQANHTPLQKLGCCSTNLAGWDSLQQCSTFLNFKSKSQCFLTQWDH